MTVQRWSASPCVARVELLAWLGVDGKQSRQRVAYESFTFARMSAPLA